MPLHSAEPAPLELHCGYLGGLPGHTQPVAGIRLAFDGRGIHTDGGHYIYDESGPVRVDEPFCDLAWSEVRDLAVEGSLQVEKRVTASRLLAFGVLAWAAKKEEKVAYLVVTTGAAEVIFEVKSKTPYELRGTLAEYLTRFMTTGEAPQGALDQLAQLGDLHATGVLTDAEFQAAKGRLLERLG